MSAEEFTLEIQQLEQLLFSFALRLTRNREDARDLMQETAIKAYRHRNTFQTGTNFKSWISTIMRNTFINHYRKNQKRQHVNEPIETFTFALENKNAIPNQAEHDLNVQELYGLLNQIGELYSVPFLMFQRGYEYHEIAEHLQIPIGTVKSRIHVARQRLRSGYSSLNKFDA